MLMKKATAYNTANKPDVGDGHDKSSGGAPGNWVCTYIFLLNLYIYIYIRSYLWIYRMYR